MDLQYMRSLVKLCEVLGGFFCLPFSTEQIPSKMYYDDDQTFIPSANRGDFCIQGSVLTVERPARSGVCVFRDCE